MSIVSFSSLLRLYHSSPLPDPASRRCRIVFCCFGVIRRTRKIRIADTTGPRHDIVNVCASNENSNIKKKQQRPQHHRQSQLDRETAEACRGPQKKVILLIRPTRVNKIITTRLTEKRTHWKAYPIHLLCGYVDWLGATGDLNTNLASFRCAKASGIKKRTNEATRRKKGVDMIGQVRRFRCRLSAPVGRKRIRLGLLNFFLKFCM